MVLVKYALLSGKLTLLQQIGEYPGIYGNEPELFRFANNHAPNLSLKDYRAVIRIVLENMKDKLCAWEYNMYSGNGIELVLYTADDIEHNEALQDQIFDKLDGYFLSMQQPEIEDLFFKIENIKLHPSWVNNED